MTSSRETAYIFSLLEPDAVHRGTHRRWKPVEPKVPQTPEQAARWKENDREYRERLKERKGW